MNEYCGWQQSGWWIKSTLDSVKSDIYGSNHGHKYLKIENEQHRNTIFVSTAPVVFLNIVITICILLIWYKKLRRFHYCFFLPCISQHNVYLIMNCDNVIKISFNLNFLCYPCARVSLEDGCRNMGHRHELNEYIDNLFHIIHIALTMILRTVCLFRWITLSLELKS